MTSVFEDLWESLQAGELIMVDGGLCQFHRHKTDPEVLTIYVILASRPGAGTEMLNRLKALPGVKEIRASCPADLPANNWYAKKGFTLVGTERARTGRPINRWVLYLDPERARESDDGGGETMLTVLKGVRLDKGLTLKDLSRLTGIHYTEISLVERGILRPSKRTLQRLSKALEVPPEDLLKPYAEWVRAH